MTPNDLSLFRTMVMAREIDRLEAEIVRRGDAFFHLSGAGHEGAACLAELMIPEDWLHCHYRSKAMMLARGVTPKNFFDALYCTADSHSSGRQMSVHMSDRSLNLLSIVGPVGNSALQAVGVAEEVARQSARPIVLCGIGDGATQQGEFTEACGEASRNGLPVLFLIEDNAWAISTPTAGKTFYSVGAGLTKDYLGIPIHRTNGRDLVASRSSIASVIEAMRADRRPAIVVFEVDRLADHTNADRQEAYRTSEDLTRAQNEGDPITRFTRYLLEQGVPSQQLDDLRTEAQNEVARAEEQAAMGAAPQATSSASRPLPTELTDPAMERRGGAGNDRLTMRDALRETLRHHLEDDSAVTIFGEDIEDPKGDVFGVTRGLSTEFPGRVCNSPLSESTILGASVGRALAGGRPVAMLQFADFMPLAFNQLATEVATLHWRTDGQWEAPVIVLAACGGYRPGLGPFHAQTGESLVAHTPGVDVFMPATAGDAAGMLNAAFSSRRPSVLLYPKALLNDTKNTTSADVGRQLTPIGSARIARVGSDLTFVGWGNTVGLCEEAADSLQQAGVEAEVLDLRSIAPWDRRRVVASAEKTARLVVVHEDNHTCGLGAEIMATVAEEAHAPVAMRRVTRSDTYVPCNYANQLETLPSHQRVLETAADLLNLDVAWQQPASQEDVAPAIVAIGSGPADETVVVAELLVKPGDVVERGQVVASLEATKSVFDLCARIGGTITEVCAEEGDTVAVGDRLFSLDSDDVQRVVESSASPTPHLIARSQETTTVPLPTAAVQARPVGLSFVTAELGDRVVSNSELTTTSGGMTGAQVFRRTGIQNRRWLGKDQSAIGLAATASRNLLRQENLAPQDLDLIICSTTTPPSVTPSTACRIMTQLLGDDDDHGHTQAYDISAACSGYLFALQSAWDYLQTRPEGRVLVVTAEALSPLLNPKDEGTYYLFGDASTATMVYGEKHLHRAAARLLQPSLSGKADRTESLTVPLAGAGYIEMDGRTVFSEAVHAMINSLGRVCRKHAIGLDDLDLVIPHQANDRITAAVRRRVGVEVHSQISDCGNTSSSSIPLCMAEALSAMRPDARVGLCAFGGGFTYGAAILERLDRQEAISKPTASAV